MFSKNSLLMKTILLVVTVIAATIWTGCNQSDLTGEPLLEKANENFQEAESYRTDASMKMEMMGMQTSSDINTIFLDDENYDYNEPDQLPEI